MIALVLVVMVITFAGLVLIDSFVNPGMPPYMPAWFDNIEDQAYHLTFH